MYDWEARVEAERDIVEVPLLSLSPERATGIIKDIGVITTGMFQ